MTDQEIRDRLRAFISDVFFLTDPAKLTDDALLIEDGIVDSTGVLDIILFLESEFGITVEDDEAAPENLGSIALIAAFVQRKSTAVVVS